MQNTTIDVGFATLLFFLFSVVTWVRSDDRAKCWFAGWSCFLVSSVAQVGQFHSVARKDFFGAISAEALAMCGLFFVVSSIVHSRGRKFAATLWLGIAIPTVVCIGLAELEVRSTAILVLAAIAREATIVNIQRRVRQKRPGFSYFLLLVSGITGAWMLYAIQRGQPALMVPAILCEVYIVAGTDVYSESGERTVGTHVTSLGLYVWGSVFPMAFAVEKLLPAVTADSPFWNPAKALVAIGMILMVVEEDLRKRRSLARDYQMIFDKNPRPLWIFEIETLKFLSVNDAACSIHGYTKEEFLQLRMPDILHPDHRETAIMGAKGQETVRNRTSRHVRKDGVEFPMDITAHTAEFQGKPCRFVFALDATKRNNLERRLEYQTGHDALTGLANRTLCEQELAEAVARAVEFKEKLAIIRFDVHRFRELVEVYGVQIGDHCIEYVASVLSASIRTSDFVARTGDDAFAIVLTKLKDATPAEKLTGNLIERFKAPALIDGYEIRLSCDMGLAICPDDGADPVAIWHLAESALRRAQAKGGNQVAWLSPELRAHAEMKIEVAASLSRPLSDSGFSVVYQPLYGIDGAVRSMEALLRFHHPRFGAISPLTVVKVAEETGLIEPLGQWVLEQACHQLHSWMNGDVRVVPIAINLSALQLMRKGFAERMMQTLYRNSIDSQWIHLEVTETAAMGSLTDASREMSILSALGCTFSVDDFGTGHSSLARLHQLPISVVKIDRSFIEHLCDCDGDCASYKMVRAIVSMAHSLGLKVVAEGVETEEQLDCLINLGCDLLQGFLLSRPVPPDKIPGLLAQIHPKMRAVVPRKNSVTQVTSTSQCEASEEPVTGRRS